jgi:hypothetical protein
MVGGKGSVQYSGGQYSGMTARDHAAPIPALVHIPLLGLRTVQDRAWLFPFRWRVHHTLAVMVTQGTSLLLCLKNIFGHGNSKILIFFMVQYIQPYLIMFFKL